MSFFGSVYGYGLVMTYAGHHIPGGSRTRVRFLVLQEFGALQLTKGTDSWPHDTDKNCGPGLLLLFKMHKILSVDYQKNY